MGTRGGSELPPTRRIWRDNLSAARLLYAATACLLLAVACWLTFALLLSTAIGRVFIDHGGLSDITTLLLAMLAVGMLRTTVIAISSLLSLEAALRVKHTLRGVMADSIIERGPLYIRGERAGELVHTGVDGIESLDAYVRQYLPARWLGLLVPLLVTAVIFAIDPLTVPILLFAGPILVLIMALIGQRTRDLARRRERELGWMSAHFLDVLQGLTTLKLFGRSKEQAATIEAISRGHSELTMDVLRTAFQTSLVLEWGAMAATALVAVTVSVRLMAGSLPFDQALALLILTPEFFLPLRELATHYHAGSAGNEVLARVYDVVGESAEPSATARPVTSSPSVSRLSSIQFKDVYFRYDGAGHDVLDGVSLQVRAGNVTVLRGATGSGKTTISNLLLRFAEPGKGSILADGRPIDLMSAFEWRRHVALVPQHPHLMAATISENLRQGRADATMSDLIEAATASGAHEFISGGYDNQVGERGTRLSGGQLQRIAIARALLKDAPVLLLDEATSHLDEAAESAVLEAIHARKVGRVVLIISHSEAVLRWADAVITLDGGRVVEDPARSLVA